MDQHLVLRTPQVETATQKMIGILQTEADPVVYLSGLSGSGVSAVLHETSQRLDCLNGIGCFKLARPEIDEGYLPPEYLLHHFGFRFGAQVRSPHYQKKLPKEVVALASMLTPSILLVEDYQAGVANLAQLRTHMALWKQLAEPPISLRIVLAGPSDHIKGSWASHQPNERNVHIDEWAFNEAFRRYLKDISLLSHEALKLDVDLLHHAKYFFELSQGNTARLLVYIRECAKNAILSSEIGISSRLFKLSFREIVHINAKLYSHFADR
ncbi:hypothetical protein [Pseudomonas amygdali]|uniref:hypothetical protein n=1 Tax=Pseudomonas amygdali TaxID=47877 RepID=UPI001179C57E|nr:hypothetical protein [Pseudomonas amygdali]